MKTTTIDLQPLQNLLNKNSSLNSLLETDLKDANLIAEFCFVPNHDSFKLFYCEKSSKYILYFWISDDVCGHFNNEYLQKYYVCENLNESIEAINEIMNLYYTNPIAQIKVVKRWWSFFPDWMFLTPILVTPHFSQFVKNFISELTATVDKNDLIEKERKALSKWTSCIESTNLFYCPPPVSFWSC